MLDQVELVQVRDYVIKILPELLRTEPEIGTTIEGILAQHFPRRDELARMLGEVREFRGETNQRFEQIDSRFEQIDSRFEQIDSRFEQIDSRFEQIDKRFDGIDRSLLLLRREQIQLKAGQESMMKRMDGVESWMSFVNGVVRNEKGNALEEITAAALRYKLQNPDIAPENVRLRQKLVDYEGTVFAKGFETEVDIIAENGELLVFEVKSTGRVSDVGFFALKVNLVRTQNPQKRVRGLFIAPAATAEIREQCTKHGLQLLS